MLLFSAVLMAEDSPGQRSVRISTSWNITQLDLALPQTALS